MAGVNGEYAPVYESFSKDIYNALEQAREELSKYHTLHLIFPSDSYFPCDIVTGFVNFCQEYAFAYSIINNISEEQIREGEVYINLMEDDLVLLLDNIIRMNMEVGEQVEGLCPITKHLLKSLFLTASLMSLLTFSKWEH